MFLLCLVSVFLLLAALCTFVFSCAVRPFGDFPRILNILVRHTMVSPWYVAIPYSESVCVFAGGAGWGFIPCFSLLLSLSSCTLRSCLCVCVCAWSVPLAPSLAFLTYFLAIPLFLRGSWASPIARARARCVGGACFSFILSLFSFTLRPCVRLGMRAWCAPLAPSFVFLTYLFALSLFPHCPWPPHTFCAFVFFFLLVVYLAVVGAYGGISGQYGCGLCLWACLLTCVVVRRSFLRAVLSLRCPPSQHTWLGFLIYECVAVDMICRMHGAVTYLVVIPLFSRGPWSCFLCLWFGVSPFVVFLSLFFLSLFFLFVVGARTSP